MDWARKRQIDIVREPVAERYGEAFVWLMMSPSDLVRYAEPLHDVAYRGLGGPFPNLVRSFQIKPELHDMMVEDGYESSYDATSYAGDPFTDTNRVRVWLDTLVGPRD